MTSGGPKAESKGLRSRTEGTQNVLPPCRKPRNGPSNLDSTRGMGPETGKRLIRLAVDSLSRETQTTLVV